MAEIYATLVNWLNSYHFSPLVILGFKRLADEVANHFHYICHPDNQRKADEDIQREQSYQVLSYREEVGLAQVYLKAQSRNEKHNGMNTSLPVQGNHPFV